MAHTAQDKAPERSDSKLVQCGGPGRRRVLNTISNWSLDFYIFVHHHHHHHHRHHHHQQHHSYFGLVGREQVSKGQHNFQLIIIVFLYFWSSSSSLTSIIITSVLLDGNKSAESSGPRSSGRYSLRIVCQDDREKVNTQWKSGKHLLCLLKLHPIDKKKSHKKSSSGKQIIIEDSDDHNDLRDL